MGQMVFSLICIVYLYTTGDEDNFVRFLALFWLFSYFVNVVMELIKF